MLHMSIYPGPTVRTNTNTVIILPQSRTKKLTYPVTALISPPIQGLHRVYPRARTRHRRHMEVTFLRRRRLVQRRRQGRSSSSSNRIMLISD